MSYQSSTIQVGVGRLGTLLIVAGCFLAGTLSAAESNTDEIVVTVRKTEENVQDIPVQVSAYGEQLIQRERLFSAKDIAELTPSLQFDTGFWPSDTRLSIRGLFARAGRPSAAVLIDGIDAQSESLESAGGSALLNQRILDIERIEVARGPQSALYGRGAFSGAINYVTRRPDQEWNYSVSADAAEDDRYELQATFGGPIIDDKLAFRALVSSYDSDGYYTNPNTGGGLGESDTMGAGLAFEWTPTDNVTAYWNTTYSDAKNGPPAAVYVKANAFRVLRVDDSGTGFSGLIPNASPYAPFTNNPSDPSDPDCLAPGSGPGGSACLYVVTGNIKADESQLDVPPDPRFSTPTDYKGTHEDTVRSNLIVDWDYNDNISFRSASSYTFSDQDVSMNTSPVTGRGDMFNIPGVPPGPPFVGDGFANDLDAANVFHFEQFYQEFQVSGESGESLNWLVGINGFWEDASSQSTSRFWFRSPLQCSGFFGPNPDCNFADADIFNKRIERDTTSTSIFGLVSWDLVDKLKLTLEGRVIRDVIEVSTNTSDIAGDALTPFDPLDVTNPLNFEYPGTPGFSDKVSENNFVPRVTLDYMLTEDAMIYTSAAKGIKPPTYITNDFSDPLLARVGSETLWTYEVGTKTQWADGRVTLNGAFFYNDYKDQQQRVQFPGLPLGSGANPRAGVVNAANVNVYGVEVDASWAPTDNLFFSASYAYTNGEYDDFVLEDVQNQSGAVPGDDDFASVSISSQAKSGSKRGDFSGNDTPGNPDHALSLLGKYQRTLTGDTEWYTQATATYQGERWADIANLVELEDYWLVNAQVGLEAERWNVAVYAENLLDDDTIQFAQEFIDFQQGFQLNTFSFPVAYWAYLPQPRTIGIRFQYRTP